MIGKSKKWLANYPTKAKNGAKSSPYHIHEDMQNYDSYKQKHDDSLQTAIYLQRYTDQLGNLQKDPNAKATDFDQLKTTLQQEMQGRDWNQLTEVAGKKKVAFPKPLQPRHDVQTFGDLINTNAVSPKEKMKYQKFDSKGTLLNEGISQYTPEEWDNRKKYQSGGAIKKFPTPENVFQNAKKSYEDRDALKEYQRPQTPPSEIEIKRRIKQPLWNDPETQKIVEFYKQYGKSPEIKRRYRNLVDAENRFYTEHWREAENRDNWEKHKDFADDPNNKNWKYSYIPKDYNKDFHPIGPVRDFSNLDKVGLVSTDNAPDGSNYSPITNFITLDQNEDLTNLPKNSKEPRDRYEGLSKIEEVLQTLPHEMSHAIQFPNLRAPFTERELFAKYRRNAKTEHDIDAGENKADLDNFRYLMYREGIYNTGERQMNKEDMEKARKNKTILGNPLFHRLTDLFDDNDIIDLNNKITYNETGQKKVPEAQMGGELERVLPYQPPYIPPVDTSTMNGMMKGKMAFADAMGNVGAHRMVQNYPMEYTFTGNEQKPQWMDEMPDAGETGTHFMSSMGRYAVPLIQQKGNHLEFMPNASPRDKEAIRFNNEGDAEYFGEHYKEVAPMMRNMKKYKSGGKVQNDWLKGYQPAKQEVPTKFYAPLPPFKPYTDEQVRALEQRQEVMRAAPEKKGAIKKAADIARNPMTAIQSYADNGRIPDNFDKGERNIYDNAVDLLNPMTYLDAIGRTASAKHFRNMVDENGNIDWNRLPDALVQTGMDVGMVSGAANEIKNSITPINYERHLVKHRFEPKAKGYKNVSYGIDEHGNINIEDEEHYLNTKEFEEGIKERYNDWLNKKQQYKNKPGEIPRTAHINAILKPIDKIPTNPLLFSGIPINQFQQKGPVQDTASYTPQQFLPAQQPEIKERKDPSKKLKKFELQEEAKQSSPKVDLVPVPKKNMDNIIYAVKHNGKVDTITKEQWENLQHQTENIPIKKNGGIVPKMQMGGNPKGWLSNYSQDDQSSRLENQRLYNEALQNPIRPQEVMKPTPEGYNPTQKDLDEHWDAFARSKGYSDYASYQMNQKAINNPYINAAGEFAEKLLNASMVAEGLGGLEKLGQTGLKQWKKLENSGPKWLEKYKPSSKYPMQKPTPKDPVPTPSNEKIYHTLDPVEGEGDVDAVHEEDKKTRFDISKKELDRLKNKHRPEFEKLYGNKYTDKDLGLFAKMKDIDEIKRRETVTEDFLKDKNEEFIEKHGIKQAYTPEEELIIDAYTRGYDDILNKRPWAFPKDTKVSKFYKEHVIPKLEEVIKQHKLQDEEILSRGDHDYHVQNVWDEKGNKLSPTLYSELKEGYEWEPESFLSTSIRDYTDNTFGNPDLKSQVIAPKGQSVLYPNASGVKNFQIELEAILPEKLRYKVEKTRPEFPYKKWEDVPEGYALSAKSEDGFGRSYVKKNGSLHIQNDYGDMGVSKITDDPESAMATLKYFYIKNNPKYTHKIVNPYLLIPFILGTGALSNTENKDKKSNGGKINNRLKNY